MLKGLEKGTPSRRRRRRSLASASASALALALANDRSRDNFLDKIYFNYLLINLNGQKLFSIKSLITEFNQNVFNFLVNPTRLGSARVTRFKFRYIQNFPP